MNYHSHEYAHVYCFVFQMSRYGHQWMKESELCIWYHMIWYDMIWCLASSEWIKSTRRCGERKINNNWIMILFHLWQKKKEYKGGEEIEGVTKRKENKDSKMSRRVENIIT